MKHFLKASALALLVLATSCSKEETSNKELEKEAEVRAKEATPIVASLVSDNVIIPGATKEIGVPPTPNEAISLDVSTTSKTALLNEGFSISLDSDVEVVGAYVQFKSNDGVVAEDYYDVKITDNISNKANKNRDSSKKRTKRNLTSKDTDVEIEVDFRDKIEPGTFCYVICVYDANGNISAPEEVCVTVESWGGNSSLVGTWNITKQVDTYDGMTDIEISGEEKCYEKQLYCYINQESEEYSICETKDKFSLLLKSDGTYVIENESSLKSINYDLYRENCEVEYVNKQSSYTTNGNWAFTEETGVLVIVEYSYEEKINGEVVSSITNEPGEGDLLYEGVIELSDNKFVINEDYGDGETYETYLEK